VTAGQVSALFACVSGDVSLLLYVDMFVNFSELRIFTETVITIVTQPSEWTANGCGIAPLNSPGGSTLQYVYVLGTGRLIVDICCRVKLCVIYRHIKGLSLVHNDIETIPSEFFADLQSLRYLRLDDNEISSLQSDTFRGLEESLRVLELNSNALLEVRLLSAQ